MLLLRYSIILLSISVSVAAFGQRDTLYLKTKTSAYIESDRSTRNYAAFKDFAAWTTQFSSGNVGTGRSLIRFNLPKIDPDSLSSATLFLQHNKDTRNLGHTVGNNSAELRCIISGWDDTKVTWNNQPSTTDRNAASLVASSKTSQDYEVDIYDMTRFFLEKPDSNHGFMLVLKNEAPHRSMKFASENAIDSTLQPILRIITGKEVKQDKDTLSHDSCIVVGKTEGLLDAYVQNDIPNRNKESFPDFACWTTSFSTGNVGTGRSLMSFKLPETPSGMRLSKAYLSLFHSNSSNLGHHGDNAASLKRITSKWEVDQVTWNNQPSTTDTNQVMLSKSVAAVQDYERIDITKLVKDQMKYPNRSFGILLSLNKEQEHRSMKFASTDHSESARHPFVEFCYSLYTQSESVRPKRLHAYPNPASSVVAINLPPLSSNTAYQLMSIEGKAAKKGVTRSSEDMLQLDVSDLPEGIYLFRLEHQAKVLKLIIKR